MQRIKLPTLIKDGEEDGDERSVVDNEPNDVAKPNNVDDEPNDVDDD